uniref:Uncharacterized protein n=1 Tax=Oreochromis aureus TaxID=47969 RepID=A0AAZ1Y193_OREAU
CPLLSWLCDVLLAGELKNVLSNISSPLAVLTSECWTQFLVSELQAARIIKYKESHTDERATEADSEKEQRVEDLSRDFCEENEGDDGSGENGRKAEMQAEWILLSCVLNMDASSRLQTFALMQVNERLSRLPSGDMTKPLLSTGLSSEQWLQVKKMNEILSEDYRRRRQMMVMRFQVTLESFAWGEKQKVGMLNNSVYKLLPKGIILCTVAPSSAFHNVFFPLLVNSAVPYSGPLFNQSLRFCSIAMVI